MEKKPAENAEEYLRAEDQRLYDELVKIVQVIKQRLCPQRISRGIAYALAVEASGQFRKITKEATFHWGRHEIAEVFGKPREKGIGRVGCFDGVPEEL